MKKQPWFLLLLFLSFQLLSACGAPSEPSSKVMEAWDAMNVPARLGQGYETKFSALPISGALASTPWTDNYWPNYQGGIIKRWNNPESNPFLYTPLPLNQLRTLSEAQIAALSPAEKLDIYLGDYSYETWQIERKRLSPSAERWEGICHGWAAAAINFSEPKPVRLKNPDGLVIPFGSSDIKALLSYYQGQLGPATGGFLGSRCNVDLEKFPWFGQSPECRDTNAGSFHIVLTNEIGLRGKGFIADLTRDRMVWNQPVHSFRTQLVRRQRPSPGAAPGTFIEHVVQTTIWYTAEVWPRWEALLGTSQHLNRSVTYQYRLELDRKGEILGGEWETEQRPDFLWTRSKPTFTGRWVGIERIYNASITNTAPVPNPFGVQ